jgi:hypothetical protein
MPSVTEVFNDLTLGRGTKVLLGADVLDPNYDTEGAPGHIFVEFFGVCMLTVITTGAVLSTGSLAVKYDLEELRPGRILGIALANAAVSYFHELFLWSIPFSKQRSTRRRANILYSYPSFFRFIYRFLRQSRV